jgi:hypothetical protein
VNALAVARTFDSFESFVNQVQQLAIVVRHRHQQLLGVRIRRHVSRILRRFSVALATIKLGGLHLAYQPFATAQQLVSKNLRASLIH